MDQALKAQFRNLKKVVGVFRLELYHWFDFYSVKYSSSSVILKNFF